MRVPPPRSRVGQGYTRRQQPDEVVVQRLINGEPTASRVADHEEVIRRMARAGFHDGQIAYVLNRRRTSVARARKKLGVPAAIDPKGYPNNMPIHDAPSRPRSAG